jgi:hypothetical protein
LRDGIEPAAARKPHSAEGVAGLPMTEIDASISMDSGRLLQSLTVELPEISAVVLCSTGRASREGS